MGAESAATKSGGNPAVFKQNVPKAPGPRVCFSGVGVLILPIVLALAWVFALLGWSPIGGQPTDDFADSAMRWMLFLPVGIQFIVSGFMHTVFAKSTAKGIGWETNGFQYEIGFVCWGLGIAGLLAMTRGPEAWLVISVPVIVFLVLAGVQHVKQMAVEKNFKPGNSLILLYDFGLPISLIALLFATQTV